MLKEKDIKVLDEMKTKIKSLPLEERVPAVAIYRLTEQYFKQLAVEEAEEEKLDAEYKVAEQAVLKENDAIISGQRACTAAEVAGINQFLKEGETCDLATHNVARPIEEYWATVLKNADACKRDLTRPGRERPRCSEVPHRRLHHRRQEGRDRARRHRRLQVQGEPFLHQL